MCHIYNFYLIDEPVYYTLGYFKTYDYVDGTCGSPGRQSGLFFRFPQTVLPKIPFRKSVEVPFDVTTSETCLDYVNIQLIISTTCETVYTYQYGVITKGDDVTVDYNTINRVANSTASFSVKWKAPATAAAGVSALDSTESNSKSFNDLRILIIAILTALVVLFILNFVVMKEMFAYQVRTILKNSTHDSSVKENPLYEFYESKSDETSYGMSESFTNSREMLITPRVRIPYDPHVSGRLSTSSDKTATNKNTFQTSKVNALDSEGV